MDNKRKHKETQTDAYFDYHEIKSKKPNIAENTFGTPSLNLTNRQEKSLPSIVLNMVNPGKITTDDARLNDNATDLDKSIRSTVITSVSLQDNGYSYYWTEDNEKINDNPSKLTACNNTTNIFTHNCDPNEYCSEVELRIINSSDTTEHTDLFQCSDDEINTTDSECSDESIRSTVITSVSQQDSGYYYTQNEKEMNGIRSKFTACNNTCDPSEYYSDDKVQKTDNFGTTKCIDSFHCSDHEMNTTSSECFDESIGSTIIQQDNDYKYKSTEDDGKTNDTRPKLTISNVTNVIACKLDDSSENYTNDEEKIANCFTTNKHHSSTNSLQCSDDQKDIASSSKNLIGSTILTSVRQQENGRYVYVTEYDKEMNEIRSEVYFILKQKIMTSPEEPLRSSVLTPNDQNPNGYNEECTRQPSTSFEHDKDPKILICTIIKENMLPNNMSDDDDDETHPKMYTNL